MKHLKLILLFSITVLTQSCINNDIINDRVDEKFSFNNSIDELTISQTYQYTTKYTDNVGEVQTPQITWSSSAPTIISVSNTGLLTSLSAGQATIRATVNSLEGGILSIEDVVTATTAIVDNSGPKEKNGTIKTTSSYTLRGNFVLKEIPNTNDLELTVDASYIASSNLPGLYLYFTNNPNTINGAKEIGKVAVFNGAHTYIIKDTGINDFSHLLYWCKPFSVKVGEGEIK